MGCVCGKESIEVEGRKFKLLECLGEGGFSYVYLAEEQTRLTKKWAVKRIDCTTAEEERTALNEVSLHTLIDHPNVIPCEAHGVIPKLGSASNTLSQRGSLADELNERCVTKIPIEESRVLSLFRGICHGVRALHSLRPEPYAHRDIKPGNVLLSDDDQPILMDLGSARLARETVTSPRTASRLQDYAAENCSMAYRAPELFSVTSDSNITEATDIWSLGCLLYAMCFYKSPFDLVHERGDSVALAAQSGRVDIPQNSIYSNGIHEMIKWLIVVRPELRPNIDDVIDRIDFSANDNASWSNDDSQRPGHNNDLPHNDNDMRV